LEKIESDIRGTIPDSVITTHLEPVEDPISFEDIELVRSEPHSNE
jgi:hypothetical protein